MPDRSYSQDEREEFCYCPALADAKPMAMNTYKLDLSRGLVVRAFERVA